VARGAGGKEEGGAGSGKNSIRQGRE
jgi:hypothetical protein